MRVRSVCAEHGRYQRGCDGCAKAAAAYAATRDAAVAEGTWVGVLRGEQLLPVVEHVRKLLADPAVSGMMIAARAGLSQHTVYRLRDGRQRTLHPDFAEVLLAVTAESLRPKPSAAGERAMVNYIGAARRLRALAADNWSTRELSELSGMCRSDLTRWRYGEFPQITLKNHERIKELYEKIQGLADPRGHGRGTATHARRLGYLPSECWNDDEIDDPDAVPLPMPPDTDDHIAVTNMIEDALMWPSPGKAAGYDRSVKREIARHAVNRLGWSYERVAELLGFKSANSVEYMLIGRKDRPRTRGGR